MKNVNSNAKQRVLCKVRNEGNEANRVGHLQSNRKDVLRAAAKLLVLTLCGTEQSSSGLQGSGHQTPQVNKNYPTHLLPKICETLLSTSISRLFYKFEWQVCDYFHMHFSLKFQKLLAMQLEGKKGLMYHEETDFKSFH